MSTTGHDGAAIFAVIAGGGTAGHVLPALAVGEALVARGHDRSSIRFVGSERGIERRLVPEAGFAVTLLTGRGIQRRLTVDNVTAALGLAWACVRSVVLVARWRPRVTVTVGGYAGVPASLASVLLRVPLVVVNPDSLPGASNKLCGRFARSAAVAFPGTPLPRAVVTGAPVRAAALEFDRSPEVRAKLRVDFEVPDGRHLLVVTGGSLGAGSINEAAFGLAAAWAARDDLTVFHIAGDRNLAAATAVADGLGLGPSLGGGLDYRLVGYEPRLAALLAACDLAVCRAGASTVAELTAIGTPSVLVPLPGAPGDHQTHNARFLADAGAARLVADGDCTAERLAELVDDLLGHPALLASMGEAAAGLGRRDAADKIAELVEAEAKVAS